MISGEIIFGSLGEPLEESAQPLFVEARKRPNSPSVGTSMDLHSIRRNLNFEKAYY